MWELYDELIADVPESVSVKQVLVGTGMTLVKSGNSLGLAETIADERRPRSESYELRGRSLREVAALIRSWNFIEASIGLAALCCWYNQPSNRIQRTPFRFIRARCHNAKVGMTANLPYLTDIIRPVAQLSLFEEEPSVGCYPLSATQEFLPEQDTVIFGGTALTNKTLPRLLELSSGAGSIVMAGFLPLAHSLLDCGVSELVGACCNDAEKCIELIQNGAGAEEILKHCSIKRIGATV